MTIARVDPMTLTHQQTWNVPIQFLSIGSAFILHEILYTLDSYSAPRGCIRGAFDLTTNRPTSIAIKFTNPKSYLCMLVFNPADNCLYSADMGHHYRFKLQFN